MEARSVPTGQRFCVVRVQRPDFPKKANSWTKTDLAICRTTSRVSARFHDKRNGSKLRQG
jgi:hypothetical protein